MNCGPFRSPWCRTNTRRTHTHTNILDVRVCVYSKILLPGGDVSCGANQNKQSVGVGFVFPAADNSSVGIEHVHRVQEFSSRTHNHINKRSKSKITMKKKNCLWAAPTFWKCVMCVMFWPKKLLFWYGNQLSNHPFVKKKRVNAVAPIWQTDHTLKCYECRRLTTNAESSRTREGMFSLTQRKESWKNGCVSTDPPWSAVVLQLENLWQSFCIIIINVMY